MKPQSKHRYLAGLWEEHLEIALNWFLRNGAKRPEAYRAPSWSWAAVDGPVDMFSTSHKEIVRYFEVIDAQTTPAPGAPETGQVIGGSLEATGPFREITVGSRYQISNDDRLGYVELRTHDNGKSISDEANKERPPEMWLHRVDFDTLDDVQDKVYGLMMEARPNAETYGGSWEARGLALALVDEDLQTYRRVGTTTVTISRKDKPLDIFRNYPKERVTIL